MRDALPTRKVRLKRLLSILGFLAGYTVLAFVILGQYTALQERSSSRWEIRDGFFYRDGAKFLIKAVGWDPTRPSELPWARKRSASLLDEDMAGIRAAGFNAIRTWELLSRQELAAAARHGLGVIMGVWVDPKGPFHDPEFRAGQLAKVKEAVRQAKASNAVIAYLVMNEPDPKHVLSEGGGVTGAFLREILMTVREEDPSALVGFSTWPGLEFFDEPALDLTAVNLHPFRPEVLMEALGYAGLVRAWREKLAGERPLLISEYGISVSKFKKKANAPGGATEQDQERELPRLTDALLRAGAAGGAIFMWVDGWWKDNDEPGDEKTHDEKDAEEWFGLKSFDANPSDPKGRARPALAAMRKFNRAVLTLPQDGPVAAREIEVEAYVEEEVPVTVEISVNGSQPLIVPAVRDGAWVRGRFGLAARAQGPQTVKLWLRSGDELLNSFERVVIPTGEGTGVRLEVQRQSGRGLAVASVKDMKGRPLAGVAVRFGIAEAYHRTDLYLEVKSDARGEARAAFDLPPAPAAVVVAAAVRHKGGAVLGYDFQVLTLNDKR